MTPEEKPCYDDYNDSSTGVPRAGSEKSMGKQAETALRESEERYSTLFENTGTSIIIIEEDMTISLANEEFARHTGYTLSEIEGVKKWTEIVDREDIEWMVEQHRLRRESPGDAMPSYEFRYRTKSGELRYALINVRLMPGTRKSMASFIDITERKRAENALRESEARYKALFTGAAEGILMADLQMKQFHYANPAICRMFGYTEDELLRLGVEDIHPQESLEHVLAEFEAQVRGEKTLAPDLPCLRKDGTLFYANISGISVVIKGHKYNVGFFTDITERKRIQDKLAQNESEMRTTLYSIGDAVISLDLNSRVLMMNPVAEKLTGWSELEARGKLLDDVLCIVNEETHCKVDNPVSRVLKEGNIVGMANHSLLIARDGTERPIGDSAAPIFDRDFNITGVVIIFRDLTKERETEAKILEQLAIIETYNGLVALADMNGKLIYINPGGIKMIGATEPDEILDKNFTDFIEQGKIKRVTDEWIPTAIREGVWNGEHTLKRIDGIIIPVAQTIFPIRDVEGNLKHMGTIIRDISIQKEMQEKLLTSEKLAVMGRLVADVAHEINNPLAIIIGRTQLILRRINEYSLPFKEQLEIILQSARRCKTILGNLLSYSKTIGKNEDAVNLVDLIREAIDNVNYQHDMSGIEVALNCNVQSNTEIIGNKVALLSVFVNLIRNARQAMGEKGYLIINIGKENDNQLHIEIHDSGIGINSDQMANLFKPFISGWKDNEGTGLGLATSLGIIETHGGKMWAESDGEGKGAKFTILLPYKLKEGKVVKTMNEIRREK